MQKPRPYDRKSRSRSRSDDPSHQQGVERRRPVLDETKASVRLTRKYAEMIDGVDLTEANVGDELNLTPHEADVLVAEGWAERAPDRGRRASDVRSVAAEAPPPGRRHKR